LKRSIKLAALLMCLSVLAVPVRADELRDLRARISQATSGFKDMKATLVVVQSNRRELEKMGKIFAETYQFKKASVSFKSPDMLKMNGELGQMRVEFITTTKERLVRIPTIRFKKRTDISDDPGSRMTSLEVGIVSPSLWDIYTVTLARTEKSDSGVKVYVMKLQTPGSKKCQLIWVDGGTLKLLRRDRILDDGSLKVKVVYSQHKQFCNAWVPAHAEVLNDAGKVAAVTETSGIVVNGGVDNKEFE
jgi:outer membrane lipoprotein-sorting protein